MPVYGIAHYYSKLYGPDEYQASSYLAQVGVKMNPRVRRLMLVPQKRTICMMMRKLSKKLSGSEVVKLRVRLWLSPNGRSLDVKEKC